MNAPKAAGSVDVLAAAADPQFAAYHWPDLRAPFPTNITDEVRAYLLAVGELIEAAKAAEREMGDAADSDFMGDEYHEAIANLRSALSKIGAPK